MSSHRERQKIAQGVSPGNPDPIFPKIKYAAKLRLKPRLETRSPIHTPMQPRCRIAATSQKTLGGRENEPQANRVSIACAAIGTGIGRAAPKSPQTCKVTFAVAYLDRLNNMNYGIPEANLKDIQKKLGDLGDVCYVGGQKADLVFFIHTTPAVYHGTRIYTNNSSAAAAATDGNGDARQRPHPALRQPPFRTRSTTRCSFWTSKFRSLTEHSRFFARSIKRVFITRSTGSGTERESILFRTSF